MKSIEINAVNKLRSILNHRKVKEWITLSDEDNIVRTAGYSGLYIRYGFINCIGCFFVEGDEIHMYDIIPIDMKLDLSDEVKDKTYKEFRKLLVEFRGKGDEDFDESKFIN